MKNLKYKTQIAATIILTLFFAGCYKFDFINQPYQADPDSFFDVEISVSVNFGTEDLVEAYFGILLPQGWTIADSVEYNNTTLNNEGVFIYSGDLVQQMNAIDPPLENYYWWVGLEDKLIAHGNDSIVSSIEIFTDSQTGTFFLDYMLGDAARGYYSDEINGLNYSRSNNHLIIVGDPVGCLPGGIIFNSQAEVDSFPVNHPDCSEIAGNITIQGNDILNLSGLNMITSVGANLWINENDTLPDLSGLENLVSIGGVLTITENDWLENLSGLENLTFIGRDLWIERNYHLNSISSLSGLGSIGKNLAIIYNFSLTDLAGLELIPSLAGSLTIDHNRILAGLSGLENLSYVAASVFIYISSEMPNLTGLENITDVGWDLNITGGWNLNSLSGLNNISTVGGSCIISYTNAPDLSGLTNLNSIGHDLEIYGNNYLLTLSGLENLSYIGRNLRIGKAFPRPMGPQGNLALTNIAALNNVGFIGGDLYIKYNDALSECEAESICNYLSSPNGVVDINWNQAGCNNPPEVAAACGITLPCLPYGIYNFYSQADIDNFQVNYPGCTQLGGDITIVGDGINNLEGLGLVNSIGGDLYIHANNLSSLEGLNNLVSIGGSLYLGYIYSLDNISGLESLTSIGGDFSLINSDILTSLSGIESLTSIAGELRIENNNSLIGLTGLDNIEAGSITDLTIINNGSLSECVVNSICDYLSAPGGIVTINNNATGCNYPGEIAGGCGITLPCLPYGNYYFYLQSQIDNFQINYPGCTEIEVDVTIEGGGITNLDGLNVLTSIGGYLSISGYNSLTSLSGLDNLTSIGGYLKIRNNSALSNITGLGGLASIGGYIVIQGNSVLSDLSGLGGLTSIGGYLEIQGNDALSDLTGLGGVTSIGEYLEIQENGVLSNLTGLGGLTSIGGYLEIQGNGALSDLSGLGGLTFIPGDLSISANAIMTSFTGLENLTSIAGDLNIGYSNSGYGNPSLVTLSGLDNLTSLGGYLGIFDNTSLTSLSGLDNLTSLGGYLSISGNNSLTSLSGLDNLTSLGGYLEIFDNTSLTSLSGLEELTSIGGHLMIKNNVALTSLSGLEGLASNGGGLLILNNDALTSLSGLESLASIGGNLEITGNADLVSLTGLENLTTIAGDLYIGYSVSWGLNYSLITLSGLDNIAEGTIENIEILYNPFLAECNIQSICDYLSSPNGTVTISNNAPGCNSRQQVEEACESQCLYGGITFSIQAQIDNFQSNYPGCTEIEGDVEICGTNITKLDSLIVLTAIGGHLNIHDNPNLTTFTGLENIEAGSIDSLFITNNSALSYCAITNICDYLLSLNGTAEIHDNAPGCESRVVIEGICVLGVEETIPHNAFSIFPNPFTNSATLEINLQEPGRLEVNIYNQIGRLLKTIARDCQNAGLQKIDLETGDLEPGVYFCVVKTNNGIKTRKILKYH